MLAQLVDDLKAGRIPIVAPKEPDLVLTDLVRGLDRVDVTLHPLGFVHYDLQNLTPLGAGEFARLHVWNPKLSPPDAGGAIHDHTWNLSSLILKGSVRNINLKPEPDESGDFTGLRVRYGLTNEFEPAGRYKLTLISDDIHSAGSTYRIPSRIVHESKLLSECAVTLVVGSSDQQADVLGPLILTKGSAAAPGTRVRQVLSRHDAQAILESLLLQP
ncbi:hypothetical protein [Pseudarthrobacter sulfonivorans]|uniref:hypothetical protein n=1 Tax=Pseudarthrobacter sulfonivorans TaxID=121292 RepID=UPI0021051B89|nr:hypothetical protein [Pseudarthrobacter sulfonivorans]